MSARKRAVAPNEGRAAGLRVEDWPLDRLIPYARNARTHSPEQVAEIAGSIRAFGFVNPILVGEMAMSLPVTGDSRPPAFSG